MKFLFIVFALLFIGVAVSNAVPRATRKAPVAAVNNGNRVPPKAAKGKVGAAVVGKKVAHAVADPCNQQLSRTSCFADKSCHWDTVAKKCSVNGAAPVLSKNYRASSSDASSLKNQSSLFVVFAVSIALLFTQ